MALTELQKRKLKVAFEIYDFDHDGSLTKDDLERAAAQTSKIKPVKAGSTEQDKLEEKVESVYTIGWDELQGVADADNNGEVSLEEWYVYFDGLIHDQNKFEQYLEAAATKLIPNLDSDGDGKITLEDYKEFFFSFNDLGKSEAQTAFQKLDTNGDGFITHDELKGHFREFYLSTDENAPGNWILGRL